MINFKNYSNNEEENKDFVIPAKVQSIAVSYDEGRLYIYINDVEVYENIDAGVSFHVEISGETDKTLYPKVGYYDTLF